MVVVLAYILAVEGARSKAHRGATLKSDKPNATLRGATLSGATLKSDKPSATLRGATLKSD